MSDSYFLPEKIFIHQDVIDFPLTERILKNTSQVTHEIISNPQELIEDFRISQQPIKQGKRFLLLAKQKGGFVKPCPCTPQYIGCNYFIINLEINCPLDCSYCILQDYLTNPLITVHVNFQDLRQELDIFIAKQRERTFRIGTGELGDSLALDHITENSKDLIAYFRGKRKVFFELKTKTVNIKNILKQEPARNIVISWSLNTRRMVQEQEKGAPPVEDRIYAAGKTVKRGYHVGFHFDPLIRYPGWERDYEEVVKLLFKAVNPKRIAWISLGSLRFPSDFASVINRRFPTNKIFHDEFIRGQDGKYRYFRPLRIDLYERMIHFIKKNQGTGVPVYLCMEGEDVWRDVIKWVPRNEEEVERSLTYLAANLEE